MLFKELEILGVQHNLCHCNYGAGFCHAITLRCLPAPQMIMVACWARASQQLSSCALTAALGVWEAAAAFCAASGICRGSC